MTEEIIITYQILRQQVFFSRVIVPYSQPDKQTEDRSGTGKSTDGWTFLIELKLPKMDCSAHIRILSHSSRVLQNWPKFWPLPLYMTKGWTWFNRPQITYNIRLWKYAGPSSFQQCANLFSAFRVLKAYWLLILHVVILSLIIFQKRFLKYQYRFCSSIRQTTHSSTH